MKPLDQASVSHKPQGGPDGTKLSDFELESLLRQRPIVSHKFVFRCPACGNQLRTDSTAKGRFRAMPRLRDAGARAEAAAAAVSATVDGCASWHGHLARGFSGPPG